MAKGKNDEVVLLADDPLWYQDAVIYELHVRAFADSTGDGVGDFRGLMGKLDYLQDLGVTAVWLLPFYPSPLRDDGYDISDYAGVHPSYGTLADFKAVLRETHRRGLRVITELVINHTSEQHPWFRRARRAPPGSPERDFYVWSDTPAKYAEARIIFKDFESSNWTWDPVANAYYWHRFYAHQPDLNYDNPEVHKAVFAVLDFWLGLGVDGLRLDAVPYLYEREGTNCENLPETHAFLKELRRHVDGKFKGRMFLAEANQWPEDAAAYFGQGDECHMNFHFPLMPRLFMALRLEDRFPVLDILQQTPALPPSCQWALFLRNHDELTLEMVTDEDRDSMYRFYAQDPQARINLGIRRRLAPLLENHRGKIELLHALLLSLPGTPVVYYGDEIGMGDNIYLGDRNGVRTPMQWSGERNAGFSRANPQRLYLPVIIDPEYHYEAVNVEAQQRTPHSLLWWMKRLIALRKRFRAFGRGTLDFPTADNPKVLAYVRQYEGECILVVANLSRHAQCVELDLGAFQGRVPVEVLGRTRFPAVGPNPYLLTLGSYAFYWFSLEPQPAAAAAGAGPAALPSLSVAGRWDEVLNGRAKQALEEALPAYLRRCPWYPGSARNPEAAHVLYALPVPHNGSSARLALVKVDYTEGEPETYLLPLGFAAGAEAERVQGQFPRAVVGRLAVRPRKADGGGAAAAGVLYDPSGDKEFARSLAAAVARQTRFRRDGAEVVATPLPALRQFHDPAAPLPEASAVQPAAGDGLVAFGDRLVLKLFRRVEEGVHPELEVGRALAEKTSFRHAVPVVGAVECRLNGGAPLTLAVLEGFVPHQGDAWNYTQDALGRFFEQALARKEPGPGLAPPGQPLLELAEGEVPAAARELLGSYLETARLLGQRTAEFHAALASVKDDPEFAPEPFTTLYQRSLYQSFRAQARRALELLRRRLKALPESAREAAQQLAGREEEILREGRRVHERKVTALRTRCHGDYHLGRVLYTGMDFVIMDLEGDTNRPLSDRRRKRSPLRDVATMICSFQYAALAAARDEGVRPEDVAALGPWARLWHRWVSATFLKGYLAVAAQESFLPKARDELDTLLRHYLLKRAVQELRDDLTNRPDRAEVPLQSLIHLLDTRA